MRRRLEDCQLDLIGEVAAITESALCAVFGGAGRALRAQARGIDPRPVLSPERQAEFQVAHALATDTNDLGLLHPLLRILSERLGRRLRRRGLVARRLRVALTYADHTDAARVVALPDAALDIELWEAARRGFLLANAKRLAVRSVSLTLDRIMEAETQMDLWSASEPADPEAPAVVAPAALFRPAVPPLQSAVDRIRTRYGTAAIGRAVTALPGRSARRTRAAPDLVPG
jgi:DNA polymerase-4